LKTVRNFSRRGFSKKWNKSRAARTKETLSKRGEGEGKNRGLLERRCDSKANLGLDPIWQVVDFKKHDRGTLLDCYKGSKKRDVFQHGGRGVNDEGGKKGG